MNVRIGPASRVSRAVLLWSIGTTTVVLFLAMAIHAAPLQPPIPAIQFTYSESAFRAILAQWQGAGVARFKAHFAIDFPFLVSYAAFGYLLCARLPSRLPAHSVIRSALPWSLPAAASFDAVENLLHLYLVQAAGPIPAPVYLLAGLVATCKWLLIGGFLAGAIYATARKRFIV